MIATPLLLRWGLSSLQKSPGTAARCAGLDHLGAEDAPCDTLLFVTEALAPQLRARTERLLEELCAISSPSDDVEGLWRLARQLERELAVHGLAVEIRDEPGAGGTFPLLLARAPRAGERYVLVVGHLDTVLSARVPERLNNELLGTGALDMKGGLAALVGALDLLAARGVPYPDDLLVAVVPDEEVGGPISERTMHQWGRGARAVLVLEPGEQRGEAETLVAGRRGMREWRLEVRGRASHSGLAFWDGRSALAAAARFSLDAAALSRPGPGPTVNVARLVAGSADFVGHLRDHAGLVGTPRQLNVVPDRAVVEGELRFLKLTEGDEVLATLRTVGNRVAADFDVATTFTSGEAISPVDPHGPGRELVERAVALAAQRGWRLEVEDERGGISFSNFLPCTISIPVLDGLGPVGGGMHTREERVSLLSLSRRTVLLADLLATL